MSDLAWIWLFVGMSLVGAAMCALGVWMMRFRALSFNSVWLAGAGLVMIFAAPLVGLGLWLSGAVRVPEGTALGWASPVMAALMAVMAALLIYMAVLLRASVWQGLQDVYYVMFPWRQLAWRRWRKEHQVEQVGGASVP